MRASKVLHGPSIKYDGDKKAFVEQIRHALFASKICSYAQGFVQLQYAAKEHDWPLNYGDCALLWRGGCIIRAVFLDRIKEAFDKDPKLENLLLAPYFSECGGEGAGFVAERSGDGGAAGDSGAGVLRGVVLLRRVPPRAAAGEFVAGAARLFWGAHL